MVFLNFLGPTLGTISDEAFFTMSALVLGFDL